MKWNLKKKIQSNGLPSEHTNSSGLLISSEVLILRDCQLTLMSRKQQTAYPHVTTMQKDYSVSGFRNLKVSMEIQV